MRTVSGVVPLANPRMTGITGQINREQQENGEDGVLHEQQRDYPGTRLPSNIGTQIKNSVEMLDVG